MGRSTHRVTSTRIRIQVAVATVLLGTAAVLAAVPPTWWTVPLLCTVLVHSAGAATASLACMHLAAGQDGSRVLSALWLNLGGAWVLVAAASTPVVATHFLLHGPGYLLSPLTLTAVASSLLLATALAAGATVRPGMGHPLTLLVLAAALVWGVNLAELTSWGAHLGPAPQLATVAALALLALAAWRLPGTPPPPTHRSTPWSVALPLLGATAAVVGEIGTSQLDLPLALHAVLPGLGLLCLSATAWRLRHATRDSRRLAMAGHRGLDTLTGLPDRHSLCRHLLTHPDPLVLLVVDLVGIRQVNEEAGHDLGDAVLTEIAARLTLLAGPPGMAARIDGDDFALVLPAALVPDPRYTSSLIQDIVRHPLELQGRRLYLSANVGAVIAHRQPSGPAGGITWPEQMLRCADQVLLEAQARPSGVAVHDEEICRASAGDTSFQEVAALHTALDEGTGLLVHLQPQHRLDHPEPLGGSTLMGCEALVRWQHPTRGLLGPEAILRAARLGHLGRALTDRVLDLAAGAAVTWWATHPLPVAVNLTTEDLDDPTLPAVIAATLARHGLPPQALSVEVVEDSLMLDPEQATATLTALRELGLQIALDDYGTGYSSLAWLHKLPVDKVKIDRSLIDGIAEDSAATAIVLHSVRLAHDLGLSVLAEGVEREEDLTLLRELACDGVQGYLTGHPMTLAQWLDGLATVTRTSGPTGHSRHLRPGHHAVGESTKKSVRPTA